MGLLGDILTGIVKGATSKSDEQKKREKWILDDIKNGDPEGYVGEKGYLDEDDIVKYPVEQEDEDEYD